MTGKVRRKCRLHKPRNDPGFTRDGQASEHTTDGSTAHCTTAENSPLQHRSRPRKQRCAARRSAAGGRSGGIRTAAGKTALARAQRSLQPPLRNSARHHTGESAANARRTRLHKAGCEQFRAAVACGTDDEGVRVPGPRIPGARRCRPRAGVVGLFGGAAGRRVGASLRAALVPLRQTRRPAHPHDHNS